MDKVLSAINYGIIMFSMDILQDFLMKEKKRTKKLLEYFQKNPDKYLEALKNGVLFPVVKINAIEYLIKLEGYDTPFSNEWEKKIEYNGFNIEIKDSIWFSDSNSFLTFNKEQYMNVELVSYQAFHYAKREMITMYSGHRYKVPSGKYLVSISGYSRKEKVDFPSPNYGYLFSLFKVDEFDGFNNPRENELYDFNVANM